MSSTKKYISENLTLYHHYGRQCTFLFSSEICVLYTTLSSLKGESLAVQGQCRSEMKNIELNQLQQLILSFEYCLPLVYNRRCEIRNQVRGKSVFRK